MTSYNISEFPKVGTLVRFKGGKKDLEFRGMDQEGRIVLIDPATRVSYLIRTDEVDWETISKMPKAIRT